MSKEVRGLGESRETMISTILEVTPVSVILAALGIALDASPNPVGRIPEMLAESPDEVLVSLRQECCTMADIRWEKK